MKKIKCYNSNIYILVDDEDWERCKLWKWYSNKNKKSLQIKTNMSEGAISIANFIMQDYNSMFDHKDRNGANNQKLNLRACNYSQNQANAILKKKSLSGFRGVYFDEQRQKWEAHLMFNYKHFHLGFFKLKEDAARVRDKKAKELWGEFAVLNFPEESK